MDPIQMYDRTTVRKAYQRASRCKLMASTATNKEAENKARINYWYEIASAEQQKRNYESKWRAKFPETMKGGE